jgi:hypothetical protein
MKASYTEYDTFRNEFGHLFYKTPFKFYRLKMEYRFTDPLSRSPGKSHSGVMIVVNAGEYVAGAGVSVSIEGQFLGGLAGDGQQAPCTPDTCVCEDTLATEHCRFNVENISWR